MGANMMLSSHYGERSGFLNVKKITTCGFFWVLRTPTPGTGRDEAAGPAWQQAGGKPGAGFRLVSFPGSYEAP